MGICFVSFIETDHGFETTFKNYFVFFGKKNFTLPDLHKKFQHYKIKTLHQYHSNVCVQADPNIDHELKADAHFTIEKNLALVIKTADCLPIMIADENQNKILAIHAGWRGVENQIITNSLNLANIKRGSVFIGPNILQNSFEVDVDVKKLLLQSYLKSSEEDSIENLIFKKLDEKYFIDLQKIVDAEISKVGLEFSLKALNIDTKTRLDLNSYRRDKENSERNLSFIVRLE